MQSSVSTTEYTRFDVLGRVTSSRQTTDGQNYTSAYSYNVSGALIEQTYPSGRVVKNTLDADGDLFSVQSKKNTHPTYWNYAWGMKYNAAGAMTEMQYGNGRWESMQYNERLQPTSIKLGFTPGTNHHLDLGYSYGGSQNNGNVTGHAISFVKKVGPPDVLSQTYTHDNLNRIKEAKEHFNGSPTPSWKQVFDIDRYGNRNFGAGTTTIGGCPMQVSAILKFIEKRGRLSGSLFSHSILKTINSPASLAGSRWLWHVRFAELRPWLAGAGRWPLGADRRTRLRPATMSASRRRR